MGRLPLLFIPLASPPDPSPPPTPATPTSRPNHDDATKQTNKTEFVGCSPSLSGAIRVNPWSVDSVADGIYTAVRLPPDQRALRHEKHWRYVSEHTVGAFAARRLPPPLPASPPCRCALCAAALPVTTLTLTTQTSPNPKPNKTIKK